MSKNNLLSLILRAIVIGIPLGLIFVMINSFQEIFSISGIIRANGEFVGGDFICFYVAGRILRTDPHELYIVARALELQREVGGAALTTPLMLPYAYPPFVAGFFAIFSFLSFKLAAGLWLIVSILISLTSIFWIFARSELSTFERVAVLLWGISFVPLSVYALAGGQTAPFGILILAGYVVCLLNGSKGKAGLFLGAGLYKPPLFLFLVILALFRREWQILRNAVISGLILTLASIALVGISGVLDFVEQGVRYFYGLQVVPGFSVKPEHGVGVLATLFNIFPNNPETCWVIFIITVSLSLFGVLKLSRTIPQTLALVLELTLSLLLSVQMGRYDAALLVVPATAFYMYVRNSSQQAIRILAGGGIGALYFSFLVNNLWVGSYVGGLPWGFLIFGASVVLVSCISINLKKNEATRGGFI